MIHSMTAFARVQEQDEWGTIAWEIRTVNHRYLEPTFRLPDGCRDLEPRLREMVREFISRGKIDATLHYTPGSNTDVDIEMNLPLVRALLNGAQSIRQYAQTSTKLETVDLLRWEGVLTVRGAGLAELYPIVEAVFKKALSTIKADRAREGQALAGHIRQRLQAMQQPLIDIKNLYPEALTQFRERLTLRLNEAHQQLNSERLEQEIAILAQKSDITEEIDRLETHCQEVERLLSQHSAEGRRLDFLMQELNREANTLSSKSIHIGITKSALELKVLIEQMREQVQNIE